MDKIKLELKIPKPRAFEYSGVEIEIDPYLNFNKQVILINRYLDDLFGTNMTEIIIDKTKYHIFEAECRLMFYIMTLNTNIDMTDIDNNIYVDPLLWNLISSQIVNYKQFRETLKTIVDEIIREETLENSIGKAVSDLIKKGLSFMESLENLNPEEIQNMGKTGLGLIERLENSSVLRNPSDLLEISEKESKKE